MSKKTFDVQFCGQTLRVKKIVFDVNDIASYLNYFCSITTSGEVLKNSFVLNILSTKLKDGITTF